LSKELETIARQAVYDDDFNSGRSHCQMWVRQCIQRVYGARFDAFHRGNAIQSEAAWKQSKYWLVGSHPTVPGDILYYTSPEHGVNGHVVIRIAGNRVAENSLLHYDQTGDGRGTRPLSAVGKPTLVVRLPSLERLKKTP
jgi:hypothetical protein